MSTRRNALGRGLGALIPPTPVGSQPEPATGSAESPSGVRTIEVALIDPNPEQPRRRFDPAQLDELVQSIRLHGVLQPVVVRRSGSRYELIVGERRWRATQAAGLSAIPAVVADVAPSDRLELAIVENVQRQDLNPIELAHAYQALASNGATQEEIGSRVSKDRSSVANHIRLLELSRDIQEDIESGRISMGHAKALLQVGNPERRHHLRNRVINERLSVRETEQLGRDIAGPRPGTRAARPKPAADPHMQQLVERLQQQLQTRVRIQGSPERGRIEVEYFGSEDLHRLTGLLLEGA